MVLTTDLLEKNQKKQTNKKFLKKMSFKKYYNIQKGKNDNVTE